MEIHKVHRDVVRMQQIEAEQHKVAEPKTKTPKGKKKTDYAEPTKAPEEKEGEKEDKA